MGVPRFRAAGRYRPTPGIYRMEGRDVLGLLEIGNAELIFDFDHDLRMISFNVAFGYAVIMPQIFQH
jgi:hypothetical protein